MADHAAPRRDLAAACAGLLLCAAPCAGSAATATLQALVDPSVVANARSKAQGSHLRNATILAKQSFDVFEGTRLVGHLVSGTARPTGTQAGNTLCFVAWIKAGAGEADILPTIGQGEWEAEACVTVRAVGLVAVGAETTDIALIYATDAPHAQPYEPVVLSLNVSDATVRLDEQATRRASEAGAVTVAAVSKALQP